MRDGDSHVVGLSAMMFQRKTALGTRPPDSRVFKPGALEVAGYDPSLAPAVRERGSGVDFVVRGEGDYPSVICSAASGTAPAG